MKKVLSKALMLMMVLTLFAVPSMAAESINVTELNDFGAVAAEVGQATVKVTADTGYYLYSAKLNGTDITASFEKSYVAKPAPAMGYDEVWTYTLAEGTLLAEDALVVTYGIYNLEHVYAGGDAETPLGQSGQDFKAYSAGCVEITDADKKDGEYSFLLHSSRLRGKDKAFVVGERYLISFDAKKAENSTATTIRIHGGEPAVSGNGGRAYNDVAVNSEWTSYTYYQDVTTADDSNYMFLGNAPETYFDNIVYARITEGGKAPIVHNINVTESTDNGVITVAESIDETETTELAIIADTGYYVASVTFNGTDITDSLTKAYASQNVSTSWYSEKWTYTIDGSTFNGDANIVVTYGEYVLDHIYTGGDAETALGEAGQSFSSYGSNNNVSITDAEHNGGGHSFTLSESRLQGARAAWEAGKYLIKYDVKAAANEATTMAVYAMSGTTVNGTTRYYVPADYFTFGTTWRTITIFLDIPEAKASASIDLRNPTDTIYVDNIVVAKLTEGAVPTPPVVPTEANVTITGANAVVSVAADTVAIGETATFTAKPAFGYYIASITIGGEEFVGFDAYKGGTYGTGALAADTEIVVTTVSYAANDKGVATEVATLPEAFAADSAAVTFGKVLDRTNATSWGIELTKDGVGVTPYHGGSYLYRANATNANGQYAIEFIGLEAGTYQIRSYMYVNGTPVFGAPATFVVD